MISSSKHSAKGRYNFYVCKVETDNYLSYLKTKFARYLLFQYTFLNILVRLFQSGILRKSGLLRRYCKKLKLAEGEINMIE